MKTVEKERAVALRNQGLSYREIQERGSVSRGSLSRWLQRIELTEQQQRRISRNVESTRRKFADYNRRRQLNARAQKVMTLQEAANMIALMMRWFRLCCQVPESNVRARIQLHDVIHLNAAQVFWSRVTGIPTSRFTKPAVKISPSSQRKQGNRLPYGTIHLRIADVRLLTRIQGWMRGLGMAPSSSPAQDVRFSA